MSENGKDLVLEEKKELELSGDVNIGNGKANIVNESETNDVNIGFNNIDNSDNKPKDNEIVDNNDEKKSDVEKNKNRNNGNSINKSTDKDDNKYKVGENADKINEMAKRLCHFGFGLLFLLMYPICPLLFFPFALGSFTMALVDDDIINDLLNNKSIIIEFCSRFCMFPELVVSGAKRGILWGEGNMLTGLITGGKIEYTQNKGLIHSTIEGVLQAIVDEKKSNGEEKYTEYLDSKKYEDKKSILPNNNEKTKEANPLIEKDKDISIGYGNKIQNTVDNVKPTKVETYENQDVVKNNSNFVVSKSSSKSSEQTKDSSSSLSNTDVDTKSNDNFYVEDNVSIASFSESKSSKSYKPSLNSTSSSSAVSSDNEKNSVKSYVSSTSSSSNTSDIKSENEQLKEFSNDFEASISDINSMSSSKSTVSSRFGGK